MGQYDQSEKLLEDHNDVFCDIVNVNLYNGRQIVAEDDLHPSNIQSHYKADDSTLHEQERDTAKYWKKGGVTFALYALENQTNPDKKMPLRIISYDGANYRSQLLDAKVQRFYPCVSIVLYFGMERWNTPKNLKEILEIPAELEPYVNDYQIHVIEVAWQTDEQVSMYQSDFRIVAEYFVQKRKKKEYQPTPLTIKHVDEVLKMLEVLGGAHQLTELHRTISILTKKEGDDTMCEMLDRTIENGITRRMPQRLAQEMAKALPQEVAKEVAKVLPQEVAKEVAKVLPQEVAKEVAKVLPQEVAKEDAALLLKYVDTLRKNLNCTVEKALHILEKTLEEYEQANILINTV